MNIAAKYTVIKLTATQYDRYPGFWQTVAHGHANAKQRPAVIVIDGEIRYRATPQPKTRVEREDRK